MLPFIVREAGRLFGDAEALVAPDGWTVSYRDLDRLSDEAAAGLARRGLGEGSVLALLLPSSPDYVVSFLAAAKIGAITTGVNPRLAPPERAAALEAVAPDLVLATTELAYGIETATPTEEIEVAERVDDLLGDIRAPGEHPGEIPEDPDRPVVIVLTSGTTGAPRGAVFCERQLSAIASIDSGAVWGEGSPVVAWGGGSSMLASTELPHIGFMTKLPWHLRASARILFMRKWRAADALRAVAEHRLPSLGGIPSQIALMLRDPDFDSYDFSCVKLIVAGGGPSPPALVREASERFGAPYSIRYSSTESGGVGTATDPARGDEEALHTVGRPRGGIGMEVRDPDGRGLPPGEVGEVCFRSPAAMAGYWRDSDATRRAIVDGWLRTGDLGLIDERGCLRLAGRQKEMFVRGGYNVYPMQVEAVLSEHPDVADVAVAPRPDAVMGEIGVAVVVPDDPAKPPTLQDLRDFAIRSLAGYKLPEALRIVKEIPLTSMQKIDRRRLASEEAAASPTQEESA